MSSIKNFPEHVMVTEQKIDLSHLSYENKEYFVRFKDRLVELYNDQRKNRVAVSLSGISGSGKSVTAAIVLDLIRKEDYNFTFYVAGLDGFHYHNDMLELKKLFEFKGRFDTYDLSKLRYKLKAFNGGENIEFPAYSRAVHSPIDSMFTVSEPRALLLVEGLWFLRNESTWTEVRRHFAYNFYIDAKESKVRDSVIDRHVRGGRTRDEAEAFYDGSDRLNSREILNSAVFPDEVIAFYKDGE